MRLKCLLAVAVASAVLGSQVALADPAPSFNWSGFYFGGHFGVGWDHDSTGIVGNAPVLAALINIGVIPSSVASNPNGPLGGLQHGCNVQRGKMVYGIEADLSIADIDGGSSTRTRALVPIANYMTTVEQNLQWFSTVRGRFGFTQTNNLLIYGTGGLALGWSSFSANVHRSALLLNYDIPASANVVKAGWTVGAGAEYALADRWSVKVEYLYYDLGKKASPAHNHRRHRHDAAARLQLRNARQHHARRAKL